MKIIRYFHRNFNYIYFILFYIIIHYFFFLIIIKILALSRLYIRYHFINWICGFIHICKNKWKKKKKYDCLIDLLQTFARCGIEHGNLLSRARVCCSNLPEVVCYSNPLKNPWYRFALLVPLFVKPNHISQAPFRFLKPLAISPTIATLPLHPPVFPSSKWNSEKRKKKRKNYSRANFFNFFFFWLYIFSTLSTIHEIQTNKKC